MTEEELERQARLWHVESPLADEKVQAISTQLTATLPRTRTRHRWKQAGIVLAFFCVPAGGMVIFGSTPKAKIEPLNQPLASRILLASDGTAMEQDSMNHEEIGIQVWKSGSSNPEKVRLPALLFPPNIFPNAYIGHINTVLSDGGWLGDVIDRPSPAPYPSFLKGSEWHILPQCKYLVLCQKGKAKILNPLPGYESALANSIVDNNIIGMSYRTSKEIVYKNITGENVYKEEYQSTIWRNGSPRISENIKKESQQKTIFSEERDAKGQPIWKAVQGQGQTSVTYEERDANGQPVWTAVPMLERVAKNGMMVGKIGSNGVTRGALWTSPTTKPRPLWEPLFAFSPVCLSCEDIDDEGTVVGTLQYPATETTAAYVWKEGRSVDLQKLLPPNSGWELTSASQVEGRFVLGRGRYHGKEAMYRLTLPPGVP